MNEVQKGRAIVRMQQAEVALKEVKVFVMGADIVEPTPLKNGLVDQV